MHKSVPDLSNIIIIYCFFFLFSLTYVNVLSVPMSYMYLCMYVCRAYVCMYQVLLNKPQQIPCVCTHLANKANSDSDSEKYK